jgi:hypothetical protein
MMDASASTKSSARRRTDAAKAAWNASPPFLVASNPGIWKKALADAQRAASSIDAPLALARHGVPVFPVSPNGHKKPLNAHGVYSATTDLNVVQHDFSQHPNALIGVPMGRRTGVFAIDVDASPPHAHDGIGVWHALETQHGVTPTRIHRTPSGGLHLLFRYPPNRSIGCPFKGLPKGIECKGEGGAIIFPPSARGGKRYEVVRDIAPAEAPDWLLEMVAPMRGARSEPPLVFPKVQVKGGGSPYGLKALKNASAAIANAGPGGRDRAVGEHVLAIGSLAAGGELDEGHALRALRRAAQSNDGADADANYCEKIERAFATGMENRRTAPQARRVLKRAARGRSKAAEALPAGEEARSDDPSCPSCPSCPGVSNQPDGEKKSSPSYHALLMRIGELDPSDEPGVRAILAEAHSGRLSDFQIEMLIKALHKAVGVGVKAIRNLLAQIRAEAAEAAKPSPEEREQLQREDYEQRKREADEEREALWRSCSRIALSVSLLAEMDAVVHAIGVVGEGAAIRGGYLAATSRLLRKRAISLLRRGAAAGGKNFLLTAVLLLFPRDSVVFMSSGSPMSLIYYGGGDENALKHKVVYVQEASILAEKNGVESPLTIMLRQLISEGCVDHLVAIPQLGGTPVTMKIKRNGPVPVIITSARDNIESEMLTRLMTSDADESPEQTMAVVKGLLLNGDVDEGEPDLTPWLNFQRWLEIGGPYDVTVPFGSAVYAAYAKRLATHPKAMQLRIRRDVSGLISAIKTSAVLHKAQRERDAKDRIIATIVDYRHAYDAFDEGVSSLYGVKTRKEVITVVKAVEAMGGAPDKSVKVTVGALKSALGINSKSIANDRLKEAVEQGALKLDEEASGSGKGRPRYFQIVKTSEALSAAPPAGVFPSPDDVLREINNPSSVTSGHADKTDKTDGFGETSAAHGQDRPVWRGRL